MEIKMPSDEERVCDDEFVMIKCQVMKKEFVMIHCKYVYIKSTFNVINIVLFVSERKKKKSFSLQVEPKFRGLEEDRFPLPYTGVASLTLHSPAGLP